MNTVSPPPAPPLVRFGDFELDLRSEELRRDGERVPIPRQSLQVLALLLERAGDLVTRDALYQSVWPDGTYVDFEHGLNAVIKRLRDALGDSAEAPRFVETLARRGYRFIAPVERPGGRGRSRTRWAGWRSPSIMLLAAGLAAAYVIRARRATGRR
jgi:DNA-binding winged helix-turn-helix (wHTH) protein